MYSYIVSCIRKLFRGEWILMWLKMTQNAKKFLFKLNCFCVSCRVWKKYISNLYIYEFMPFNLCAHEFFYLYRINTRFTICFVVGDIFGNWFLISLVYLKHTNIHMYIKYFIYVWHRYCMHWCMQIHFLNVLILNPYNNLERMLLYNCGK